MPVEKLWILIFVAAAVGCDFVSSDGAESATSSDVIPVVAGVLNQSDDLSSPRDLAFVGDHLVLLDNTYPAIHVLDASRGTLLRSFGREGRGPGEFEGVRLIDPVPGSDEQFWVYDLGLRRWTLLNTRLALSDSSDSRATLRVVNLRTELLPMNPVWVNDTLMISAGLFTDGRLALLDETGHVIRTVGDLPPQPRGENVPAAVLQHAYTGNVAISPDRKHLALATRHADIIEIFRTDGTLVKKLRGSSGFDPVYEARRLNGAPYMSSGEDLRFGYIDVTADDGLIYALFSGVRRGDAPGEANYGNFVHVFDWSGNPVKMYQLDQRVFAIAVGSEQNLFAIRHDPVPAVLTYTLNSSEDAIQNE